MNSKNVLELTEDTFDREVLQSNIHVVVDFWAPWCRPCRDFAPIFEDVANNMVQEIRKQTSDDIVIKFAKVNVDNSSKYADQFSIKSIPTVCIFKDGKLVNSAIGIVAALDAIQELFQSLISHNG